MEGGKEEGRERGERERETRVGSLLEQMTARNWFLPFGDANR